MFVEKKSLQSIFVYFGDDLLTSFCININKVNKKAYPKGVFDFGITRYGYK